MSHILLLKFFFICFSLPTHRVIIEPHQSLRSTTSTPSQLVQLITMASTVTVSTTLPYVEDYILESITTNRLIIRPLLLSDLEAYRTLRSQPEAMAHSGRGRPDIDLSETLAKLLALYFRSIFIRMSSNIMVWTLGYFVAQSLFNRSDNFWNVTIRRYQPSAVHWHQV